MAGKLLNGLLSELVLAADRLGKLVTDKRRLRSAIKLAKSAVILAPAQLFTACEVQQQDRFKLARQLRKDILSFPVHEEIMRTLRQLKLASVTEADNIYSRAELSSRFHKRSLKGVCGPLKLEFSRDFLQITCRPDLSEKELLNLKEFIKEDLKDTPEPTLTQQEREDDELVLIQKVPQKVKIVLFIVVFLQILGT
jgi:hypothetical protein